MSTIPVLINGYPVDSGDYIGVFFDSLGTLACGGYAKWENKTTAISAWGEDAGNDGFQSGEKFIWKIWRKSENLEYFAFAKYNGEDFINLGNYAVNGLSGLESLIAYNHQEIEMINGWSYFSTYIDPVYPATDSIFADIENCINIIKDEEGGIYFPGVTDQLHALIPGKGYQANMKKDTVLTVTGNDIQPLLTPLTFSEQVMITGYLRKETASLESLFHDINNNLLYIKDAAGNLYIPEYNINTLANFAPGKGYKIKLYDTITYLYPDNNTLLPVSDTAQLLLPERFSHSRNTGNNMILIIPASAWNEEPEYGDEIAAFAENALYSGSAVYIGSNIAMVIWGKDAFTEKWDGMLPGEKFTLLYWHKFSNKIDSVEITRWERGDDLYRIDSINIIDSLRVKEIVNTSDFNYQLAMNPSDNFISFSFFIPVKSFIELTGFTADAKLLGNFLSQEFQPGSYSFSFEINNPGSAVYFFRMRKDDQIVIKKMVYIRTAN